MEVKSNVGKVSKVSNFMKGVRLGFTVWFCANPNVFLRLRKLEVFTQTLGEGKQVIQVQVVVLVTSKTQKSGSRTWYDVVTTHSKTHTHTHTQPTTIRGGK